MAHMMTRMTRMTRWLDSHDSLARWLTVCQDPVKVQEYNKMLFDASQLVNFTNHL